MSSSVYQRSSSQAESLSGIPRNSPTRRFVTLYKKSVILSLSLFLSLSLSLSHTHTHTHTHTHAYIYIFLRKSIAILPSYIHVYFQNGLFIPFPDQNYVIISPFPTPLCPTHPIVHSVFVRQKTKIKNCKQSFHIMQKIIVDPLLTKLLLLTKTVVT